MFSYIKTRIKHALLSNKSCAGFTMLELILASAVGAIVIAGGYSSYVIIAKQYERITAFSQVQQQGIPTLKVLMRDIRMAGRVAMDDNIDPVLGTIATPITITDSGNACCDSITVVYDKDVDGATPHYMRCQIEYSVAPKASDPTRNVINMAVTTLSSDNGDLCTGDGSSSIVTDYVEDLQFEGSDPNADGNPQLVDISLVIRSRSMLSKARVYTKPAQVVGDYDYSFNDKYNRDEFTATVNLQNLRD